MRDEFEAINHELESYSKILAKKEQIVVFNKADATISEIIDDTKKKFSKYKPLFISAVSGEGLDPFLYRLKDEVLALRKKRQANKKPAQEHKVFRPHEEISDTKNFSVEKTDDGFRVTGRRIEQLAIMTDMTKKGGIFRMQDILTKIGAYREINKLGGKEGDKIHISERTFDYMDLS